jgi:glycosyltransferase involved in cell wall biosynthesis
LCTTWRDGVLADLVAPHVARVCLRRRRRLDLRAVNALTRAVRQHDIQVLHAHETSLFLATAASLAPPYPAVVWHDHFGNHGIEERAAWLYGPFARRAQGVITVNEPLASWARDRLGLPASRVEYVPNFVCPPSGALAPAVDLPGVPGRRIVCLANFRPQKDHLTLIRAMAALRADVPDAHLMLAGAPVDPECEAAVRAEVRALGIENAVTFLGSRRDVWSVLRASDIGVLSSASEGLPLALIEYGVIGLAAVATDVGQCADVLDGGRAGTLVPARSPETLREALRALLASADRRLDLGRRLLQRIRDRYAPEPRLAQVADIYERALSSRAA